MHKGQNSYLPDVCITSVWLILIHCLLHVLNWEMK